MPNKHPGSLKLIGTISILYVDDDPPLLESSKLYLERTNEFRVITAPSASAALRLLKSQGIQAIISDYLMPDMDGIAFLKRVREMDRFMPFILFTGKGREDIAIEAFESGADFYIQKGGEPKPQIAELLHKIHTAVHQRRADARNISLNRLHTMLSATNKAIVHIHNKGELLEEICRAAVDSGGFGMAWVGLVDEKKHRIEPVASRGNIEGYLDTLALSPDTVPPTGDPTETAFRNKTCHVCNDIATDPETAPWRDGALQRGYRSLAAFPFAQDTRNAGVITFYASDPGFFDPQVIRLLNEQAEDITYALAARDREEQRINAEKELRSSETRYRRLFETAHDGILILEEETGMIIDANPYILNLLGYPLDYFVGKYLWELGFFKDKSLAQNAFAELKTNGYIKYEDLPLETKDGTPVEVEFVSNVYPVNHHKIIQCNIRDITARKRAEKALTLVNRKLNLLSSITRHDIRNQLLVLRVYLELSKESPGDAEKIAEYIGREEKAANAIERQIVFTKEYEDMGILAPTWQEVNASIGNAIAALPIRDIRLQKEVDSLEVYADPLFEKVFYNLIDNALRYAGEKLSTIRIVSRVRDRGLVITFEDDGEGISGDDKKILFERGFGRNTGLGLFLSREVLSITGMTIEETSETGKGARFEITVPKGLYRFAGGK